MLFHDIHPLRFTSLCAKLARINKMKTPISLLKQSDIFYQLTTTQLELVANLCEEVTYQTGDIIFKENSSSKELYVITQGEVEITINTGASASGSLEEEIVIAKLRRGQSFGEIALVDEGLRSASARAAQKDTGLIIIHRDQLIMLCESYPQLGYRLMHNLAADLAMKIRNTDLHIREPMLYTAQRK
jgi:CRP/FNR family transcriptional regulator, cyclic AMP receptor protein